MTTKKCPICGERISWEDNPVRPFCSARCKTIDLGTWAAEKYRIIGENIEDLHSLDLEEPFDKSNELQDKN